MSENVFPLAFAYIQMLILSEISPNKHTLSLHCSAPQNAQTIKKCFLLIEIKLNFKKNEYYCR